MQQFTDLDDPMDIARDLQVEYRRLGTLAAVSGSVGMSVSAVSRYIALLKLPVAAQKAVSDREIPVANAARVWANKSRKSKVTILPNHHQRAYELVGDKVVITVDQLSRYLNVSTDSVRRSLVELTSRGLVECHKEIRPYVYRLSSGGAARLGKTYQRKWISASVMHQYLMRNEIDLKYSNKSKTAIRLLSRRELWRAGINPAHGEHVIEATGDFGTRWTLVIIDDYQMPLDKIIYKLVRDHNPKIDFYQGDRRYWYSLIFKIVIYTCEKGRAPRHRFAIKKLISDFDRLVKFSKNDTDYMKERKKSLQQNRQQILSLLETIQVSYLPPQWRVY